MRIEESSRRHKKRKQRKAQEHKKLEQRKMQEERQGVMVKEGIRIKIGNDKCRKGADKTKNNPSADIKYQSSVHYVLSSLIPYTEANLKLVFKPTKFFDDLERLDRIKTKRATIAGGYYKLIRDGLVKLDDHGVPRLTEAGIARLKRYEPSRLTGAASILVIFDIPEEERRLRQRLRTLLRELRFTQVQKSVWQTEYDILEYLTPELKSLRLQKYVQVYESAKVI